MGNWETVKGHLLMIKSKSHLLSVFVPSTSCCMDADGFVEEGGRWYKALVNTTLPTQGSLSHPLLRRLALWSNALGSQNETLRQCNICSLPVIRFLAILSHFICNVTAALTEDLFNSSLLSTLTTSTKMKKALFHIQCGVQSSLSLPLEALKSLHFILPCEVSWA